MKCPLRLKVQKRPLGEAAFGVPESAQDFDNCIHAECSWWETEKERCIITRIDDIADKLQNPGQ